MNLFDMFRRQDPNLVASAAVRPVKRRMGGEVVRGFELQLDRDRDLAPALELNSPREWYAVRSRTEPGWTVSALNRRAIGARCALEFVDASGTVIASSQTRVTRTPRDLTYPDLPAGVAVASLRLSIRPTTPNRVLGLLGRSRGAVLLGVNRSLDRSEVLSLCRGRGVEVGPGPKPQVHPGPGVDVLYVEESLPEEWSEKYNAQGKYDVDPELWASYVVGAAHDLPVEDHSLDFVFSSHVFEHLANPLGHLAHWRRKLKPGGLVLAIVPDACGCKDYVFEPSSLQELVGEHERGGYDVSLDHYRRWAAKRAPARDPQSFMDAGRSIHAHFYTLENMEALLREAVKRLGFASHHVEHTRNHKDFFFSLKA